MSDDIRCPHCQTELTGFIRMAVKTLKESKKENVLIYQCPTCNHTIQQGDFLAADPRMSAAGAPVPPIQQGDFLAADAEANLRRQEPGMCWFCGKRQAEDSAASSLPMYKVLSVRTELQYGTDTVTHTSYNQQTVKISRCAECASLHARLAKSQSMGCLVGSIIVFLPMLLLLLNDGGSHDFWDVILGVILAGGIALFVGGLFGAALGRYRKRLPAGVLPESDGSNAPVVKELNRQGWGVGYKPPDPVERKWWQSGSWR